MSTTPSVRRNVVANAVGQGWSLLLAIALVPVYIGLLGVESYGLVGLFVTLQAALAMLDFGLAATINRELARGTKDAISANQMRDIARTFECLYWPVAVGIAGLALVLAPSLAGRWLKPVELSVADVAYALTVMGFVAGAQFPTALYAGGLAGLQRQVLLNGLQVTFATLRSAGVVIPLLLVERSVAVFFEWQLAMSVLQTIAFGAAFWRAMPGGKRPAFSTDEVRRLIRFTGGIAGMAITSFVLLQFDRVILAALLDLKAFGYYVTAATLAGAIPRVVQPIAMAVYPRYSQLVATGDGSRLVALYHMSSQTVAVLLATVGAVGFNYSGSLLLAWTGSADIAQAAGAVLAILVLSNVAGALASLPYSLQLAYGNSRLSFGLSVVGAAVYVPSAWYAASRFGPLGASSVWLALNVGLLLLGVQLMHRSMLVGELRRWYVVDILPVFAAAFAAGAIVTLVWPGFSRTAEGLLVLGLATMVVGMVALAAARDVNKDLVTSGLRFLQRLRT